MQKRNKVKLFLIVHNINLQPEENMTETSLLVNSQTLLRRQRIYAPETLQKHSNSECGFSPLTIDEFKIEGQSIGKGTYGFVVRICFQNKFFCEYGEKLDVFIVLKTKKQKNKSH